MLLSVTHYTWSRSQLFYSVSFIQTITYRHNIALVCPMKNSLLRNAKLPTAPYKYTRYTIYSSIGIEKASDWEPPASTLFVRIHMTLVHTHTRRPIQIHEYSTHASYIHAHTHTHNDKSNDTLNNKHTTQWWNKRAVHMWKTKVPIETACI